MRKREEGNTELTELPSETLGGRVDAFMDESKSTIVSSLGETV